MILSPTSATALLSWVDAEPRNPELPPSHREPVTREDDNRPQPQRPISSPWSGILAAYWFPTRHPSIGVYERVDWLRFWLHLPGQSISEPTPTAPMTERRILRIIELCQWTPAVLQPAAPSHGDELQKRNRGSCDSVLLFVLFRHNYFAPSHIRPMTCLPLLSSTPKLQKIQATTLNNHAELTLTELHYQC